MRDVVFFLGFLPLPFLSFAYPWLGLLLWGWIAFVSPHRELWGFAADIQYNLIIAVATIAGWFVSRERKALPGDATTVLLLALVVLELISTVASLAPELSWPEFEHDLKIFAFVLLLGMALTSRVRIHAFVWLMALCLGYFGVKGGTLFILTLGDHTFRGPPKSMIGDENALALALLMTIPLMHYLYLHSRRRLIRLGLLGAIALTGLAVLSTYSRGGLVGLVAMVAVFWWKTKRKGMMLLLLVVAAMPVAIIVPQKWTYRMETIETAAVQDTSFRLRLLSWQAHLAAALDRPLVGAGPYALQSPKVFFDYARSATVEVENDQPRAAHSIYLQVLGELGFIALGLYLALLATAWFNARWVLRQTRDRPELRWMFDLARMAQVSLAGFLVAGAALSMAFYDYALALLIVLAALRRLARRQLAAAPGMAVAQAGGGGGGRPPRLGRQDSGARGGAAGGAATASPGVARQRGATAAPLASR